MLGSSHPSADAARELGRVLTGTEAKDIADRLTDGDTVTAALKAVAAGRRPRLRSLLEPAGPAVFGREQAVAVLRAVEGARSTTTAIDPLWTMPGHLAGSGPLTSSVTHLVDNTRQSVTCSTFNFQRTSGLWAALRRAALRPEIALRVYVDTAAADHGPNSWAPSTREVAVHLHPGIVLRTTQFDGASVRNHAKFLAIDHRFLLVTSANWSVPAPPRTTRPAASTLRKVRDGEEVAMTTAQVAGEVFELNPVMVERTVLALDPEPIREHYVVIGGRRYPPKQALAAVTGLDRSDFTTHQARSILRRLGFGVHRRRPVSAPSGGPDVPERRRGSEAAVLRPYVGRWVAQDGLEVLFDAESPQDVVRWLRRNGLSATVWRVPATAVEAGSMQSAP